MRWLYDDEIARMTSPVRCTHCGGVYDLGTVTVTGRYIDCTTWKAPCCGVPVDDRGDTGWKSRKDYIKIDVNAPPFDEYRRFRY
jgi:hypothetical protein